MEPLNLVSMHRRSKSYDGTVTNSNLPVLDRTYNCPSAAASAEFTSLAPASNTVFSTTSARQSMLLVDDLPNPGAMRPRPTKSYGGTSGVATIPSPTASPAARHSDSGGLPPLARTTLSGTSSTRLQPDNQNIFTATCGKDGDFPSAASTNAASGRRGCLLRSFSTLDSAGGSGGGYTSGAGIASVHGNRALRAALRQALLQVESLGAENVYLRRKHSDVQGLLAAQREELKRLRLELADKNEERALYRNHLRDLCKYAAPDASPLASRDPSSSIQQPQQQRQAELAVHLEALVQWRYGTEGPRASTPSATPYGSDGGDVHDLGGCASSNGGSSGGASGRLEAVASLSTLMSSYSHLASAAFTRELFGDETAAAAAAHGAATDAAANVRSAESAATFPGAPKPSPSARSGDVSGGPMASIPALKGAAAQESMEVAGGLSPCPKTWDSSNASSTHPSVSTPPQDAHSAHRTAASTPDGARALASPSQRATVTMPSPFYRRFARMASASSLHAAATGSGSQPPSQEQQPSPQQQQPPSPSSPPPPQQQPYRQRSFALRVNRSSCQLAAVTEETVGLPARRSCYSSCGLPADATSRVQRTAIGGSTGGFDSLAAQLHISEADGAMATAMLRGQSEGPGAEMDLGPHSLLSREAMLRSSSSRFSWRRLNSSSLSGVPEGAVAASGLVTPAGLQSPQQGSGRLSSAGKSSKPLTLETAAVKQQQQLKSYDSAAVLNDMVAPL